MTGCFVPPAPRYSCARSGCRANVGVAGDYCSEECRRADS